MARTPHSETPGSSPAHANFEDSSAATSLASFGKPDILRIGAVQRETAGTFERVRHRVQSSLSRASQSHSLVTQEGCTHYGSKPLTASWYHSFSTGLLELQPEGSTGAASAGSSSGTSCGSGCTRSSTSSRLTVLSPPYSVDSLYCQRQSRSTEWATLEDCHAFRDSTAASLSGGSGSPVYRPSGFHSFPQSPVVFSAGVLSPPLFTDALPALQALPAAYPSMSYLERHQEGRSRSCFRGVLFFTSPRQAYKLPC